MAFIRPMLMVICLTLPGILPAQAKDSTNREVALLDRPQSVQRVPPKSPSDPVGELRCSYYKDLMIRETGTNTPAPGAATLIPLAAGPMRPLCADTGSAGERVLQTAGFSFLGRKGPFLFFQQTNPNGAVPFMIIDATDGKPLYHDSEYGDGLRSIKEAKSSLHLLYTRGVNGACSIYREGPACWAKMMDEGKVPRVMELSQPSVQLCGTAYRKLNVSADVPSIVYYDVNVTLGRSGKVHVNSRGETNCAPVP